MCSGLLPRVDRGGDPGVWCSRCSGGYRRLGLKLVVSLSYPLFKSLRIRVSFLPLFENEVVYEKELSYLLSKQADI